MKNLEEKKYWVWLSLIPDLGSRRKRKLLEIYKNPETIYKLKEEELLNIDGIGLNTAKNIVDKKTKQIVDKHIEYMWKNNINIISICDNEYPNILKEIYDPPISLYCKGNEKILNNKALGIVGCREATQYGKSAAKYFAYNLAKQNVSIISGLAKGVDSYAHIGTICAQFEKNYPHKKNNSQNLNYSNVDNSNTCGKTIAVLGNGLDMKIWLIK